MNIRKAHHDDYVDVYRIGDEQLGKGYFQEVLNSNSEHLLWVAIDPETNEVRGFLFVILQKKTAIIKTLAIQQKYQRTGFGTRLLRTALEELLGSVDRFEVIAWELSDTNLIPLESILVKTGFVKSHEITNYWLDDSIQRGYSCPSCGNPCQCSAVIFSIPSSDFVKNND